MHRRSLWRAAAKADTFQAISRCSPKSDSDENTGERASVYLSSYRAAKAQGLPDDFITKFLKIHSYDVDFKQRVKAGDSFELFYDLVQEEGGAEKPGELLYALVNIGGETHGYYRFRTPDGVVDYYDDKGSNAKKFLMRMPVRAARLTSGFGYRRHPLLKTLKLHSGVDWAGPSRNANHGRRKWHDRSRRAPRRLRQLHPYPARKRIQNCLRPHASISRKAL